jgi:hypothetical protein
MSIKFQNEKGSCPKRSALRRVLMAYLLNGGQDPKAYIKTHRTCLAAVLDESTKDVENAWWSIAWSVGWGPSPGETPEDVQG